MYRIELQDRENVELTYINLEHHYKVTGQDTLESNEAQIEMEAKEEQWQNIPEGNGAIRLTGQCRSLKAYSSCSHIKVIDKTIEAGQLTSVYFP